MSDGEKFVEVTHLNVTTFPFIPSHVFQASFPLLIQASSSKSYGNKHRQETGSKVVMIRTLLLEPTYV